MSQASIEKELRPIRQRLDAIEESLPEEMTEEDKRDLKRALEEHKRGKSVQSSTKGSLVSGVKDF
jgi:hypothetical protein